MSDEPDKTPEPPGSLDPKATEHKRKWYQYSLRSLLIVMVLFCFLFAWIGVKIQEAEKQREVVAWVKENGGKVRYEYERQDEFGKLPPPPGPDWLRNLIGIHYFSDVIEADFQYGRKVKDLSPLEDLTKLESLSLLNNRQVEDISPLANLTNLNDLTLDLTQVKDISPLANLTNLNELTLLRYSQVEDFSPLKDLPNLTQLTLWGSRLTDFSTLNVLQNLSELELRWTQVNKEEVQKLQEALPNCFIFHNTIPIKANQRLQTDADKPRR